MQDTTNRGEGEPEEALCSWSEGSGNVFKRRRLSARRVQKGAAPRGIYGVEKGMSRTVVGIGENLTERADRRVKRRRSSL